MWSKPCKVPPEAVSKWEARQMSTTKLLSIGLVASAGAAALAMTANAQSRYGNVYDYESGRNCGQACVAPAASARYGTAVTPAPTYNPAPIYVDCTQTGTCAPQATTVYTQPAPVYTQPAPTYSSATTYSQAEAVSCPAGTTAQSDGTCLESSGYTSGTTYSSGSTSSYSSSTSYNAEPVSCPAGTTAQSDGTCLQSGSSSYSTGSTYSSVPSYTSSTTDSYSSASTYSSEPVNCPAGTTAQADGTCMQGGSAFSGASVEIYQGDAGTNSSTGYGYTGGSSYKADDYLPIRK